MNFYYLLIKFRFSWIYSEFFNEFHFLILNIFFLIIFLFSRRAIESDHVKRTEFEIVTSVSETDDGDAYGLNERNDKGGDGADDDSIDIDYEGSTSDSTNIEHSFTSSTTEFAHINKCRGDESVSCPKNPHIRICEVQFCDLINDCPDNEDEDPSKCAQTGWTHFIFIFTIRFISFHFIIYSFRLHTKSFKK